MERQSINTSEGLAWSPQRIRRTLEQWCKHETNSEVVGQKWPRKILRIRTEGGSSVILKLWSRPGCKAVIKRFLRSTAVNHEWSCLGRAHRRGLKVPCPLGMSHLRDRSHPYTEALVMEDLGPCTNGVLFIKECISNDQETRLRSFEGEVIDLTEGLVSAGILDTDHSLMNIIVPTEGSAWRVDLETAQIVWSSRSCPVRYGRMIGRLLVTHVFAVQPEVSRSIDFARRLAAQLPLPDSVKRNAYEYAKEMLYLQKIKTSLRVQIPFPW